MDIRLTEIAKRYQKDWVLYGVTIHLEKGNTYAITGPNGSGKSTFLKLLCGHLSPTKGTASFSFDGQSRPVSEVYKNVSFAAPYIELIEELTLLEALDFHKKFRPFSSDISSADVIELTGLNHSKHKQIRHFSSGMKQRLKLALALCTQSQLILLDEPTTNLDKAGSVWYHELVSRYQQDRLLVVASNVEEDYAFCTHQFNVMEWKPQPKAKSIR